MASLPDSQMGLSGPGPAATGGEMELGVHRHDE